MGERKQVPCTAVQRPQDKMVRRAMRRSQRLRVVGIAAVAAVAGISFYAQAASGSTFTYSPANTTTDFWSTGTNWSAVPVSDPSTELTFDGNNATALTNFTNTNTDEIAGLFQLNILDL